jgi:TIR domain-containing protein
MLLARDNELAPTRLAQWKHERDLLEKHGLITCHSDGSYRIFSTSFKQWLMDNLYDLDDGRWQVILESPIATVSRPAVFPERAIKHLVFISYSHKDEQEKEALLTHVRVLEQGAGLLNVWSDDRIAGGEQWEPAIEEAISSAKVAILLVSANFLTSDFITRREVPELLRRREREGLRVIPVIARPCAWQHIGWLAAMNVRPKNGNPIWGQFYAEEELVKIAHEVATLVQC